MKYLLTAMLAFGSFAVSAQNVFLDRAYWKTAPNVASIQAEIQKGNDPAALNSANYDPVVLAISEKAPNESIKFLLSQKGNDVNKLTHDGRTYIFWSATAGNTEIMEFLLNKGAKVNMVDDHGANPVNFAAGSGQANTKVYDLLLSKGADLKKDVNQDGANALLISAGADKDFALLNYFTSKGLDINNTDANGNTIFNYVARTGKIDVLAKLIEKGVKYNDNAFLFAAQGGRSGANTLELYQYLENLKLKPTVIGKNGETVLHAIARKDKQSEIIKYFISKGVDVNKADIDGNTAFMNAAAANRDLAAIELLGASVKDINQKNKNGLSALALAVRGNSPEVVAALIAKGADVKVVDKNGDNLAYYLVQSYTPQNSVAFDAKLKLLQDKGLNFAAPQQNGNTLYHLAVAKNDLTLIKKVEGLNIDKDAKNKEGYTALHKAAMSAKDDSLIKYMLEIGAKKATKTEFDETAYDLAKENEYLSKNKVSIDFLK
ncbi:ankyrin repeat domain-containing protein [Daejeonella lutea]|uniref:Ankyrin repeat n=1 Tax=Daejeonella lutea TaxID=572036 RepID=A0A1T5BLZ0_9SPHI|nr:ankyrin repeat domain-containing protein [Daejeonella lutea]SKB48286.1 Ankyrin repeat [Daejeonella lutea]